MSALAPQEAAGFPSPLPVLDVVPVVSQETTGSYAPQPTLEQEMLASIARTAFMGEADRIPLIDLDTLSEGNDQVQQKFGDHARRLLIVGPDAVKSHGKQAEIIRGESVAELLESRTDFVSGINGVLISDIRHHKMYKTARHMHSLGLYETHILEGGPQPAVLEPAEVDAARFTLRACQATHELDDDQRERFMQLSYRAASMLNQGSNKFHIVKAHLPPVERQTVKSWIADELSPKWHDNAPCKGPGMSELFYRPPHFEAKAKREKRENQAKAVCASCPVRTECLETSIKNVETDGIWGGLTPPELRLHRVMLARQQKAETAG